MCSKPKKGVRVHLPNDEHVRVGSMLEKGDVQVCSLSDLVNLVLVLPK